MHTEWTDRLSDYLDGDLAGAERAALEAHLSGCAPCRTVLAELREVVRAAERLGERAPTRDLWPEIEARTRGPVRFALSRPLAVAASLALLALPAWGVWKVVSRGGDDLGPAAAAPGSADGGAIPVALDAGDASAPTSAAIAELEQVLDDSRAQLDPETVRVIDENLAMIDQAIDEVRRALAEDPASDYLNLHLNETLGRKLNLLREAGTLAAQML